MRRQPPLTTHPLREASCAETPTRTQAAPAPCCRVLPTEPLPGSRAAAPPLSAFPARIPSLPGVVRGPSTPKHGIPWLCCSSFQWPTKLTPATICATANCHNVEIFAYTAVRTSAFLTLLIASKRTLPCNEGRFSAHPFARLFVPWKLAFGDSRWPPLSSSRCAAGILSADEVPRARRLSFSARIPLEAELDTRKETRRLLTVRVRLVKPHTRRGGAAGGP